MRQLSPLPRTNSSSGYDWASSPNIWFDGAGLGTIGSVNDFHGDERGETESPAIIAKCNGLTHTLRRSARFEIVPLDYVMETPSQGAHPRSWARVECGKLVLLLALRPTLEWEINPLWQNTDDPRIKKAVRCVALVVVASKTGESIASTKVDGSEHPLSNITTHVPFVPLFSSCNRQAGGLVCDSFRAVWNRRKSIGNNPNVFLDQEDLIGFDIVKDLPFPTWPANFDDINPNSLP